MTYGNEKPTMGPKKKTRPRKSDRLPARSPETDQIELEDAARKARADREFHRTAKREGLAVAEGLSEALPKPRPSSADSKCRFQRRWRCSPSSTCEAL